MKKQIIFYWKWGSQYSQIGLESISTISQLKLIFIIVNEVHFAYNYPYTYTEL